MKTAKLLLVSLLTLFVFAQKPATVVELATNNPDFSTLVELLAEAGQVELLSGEGPFTVFAPTNAAFEALPPGLLDGIRSSSISLQSVLSYHVIRGAVTAEAVLALELLRHVFGVACDLVRHPQGGRPFTVPRSHHAFDSRPGDNGVSVLESAHLAVAYDRELVLADVSVKIPQGRITAIIGANGCGKSTLLRSCARLLKPRAGEVRLLGTSVFAVNQRAFAQQVAVLSQSALAPPGVLVEELVALGRHPYQRWYRQWSRRDQEMIDRALAVTGCSDLRDRAIETLSGGQRQRVWLAMALAQDTEVLLLDEPTTFLDIAHQVEMLDLVHDLNREHGRTVVLVVHDLCHACRYADYLIALRDGEVVAAGPPREVVSETLVREVFALESCVVSDPVTTCPLVLPRLAAQHNQRHEVMLSDSYEIDNTVKDPMEVLE